MPTRRNIGALAYHTGVEVLIPRAGEVGHLRTQLREGGQTNLAGRDRTVITANATSGG